METATKQEGKMDMQAMMEVYKKVATPGTPHKLLAGLAGTWTTRTRAWMEPDKPPMENIGACEQKMLLGGRYLLLIHQPLIADTTAPFPRYFFQ